MDNTVVGTLSVIELVWLLLHLSGVVVSAVNIRDGVLDRRQLHAEGVNGVAEVVVVGSIGSDLLRLGVFLLAFGLGVFGALAPPMNTVLPVSRFYQWYRWMGLVSILGIGVLVWCSAVLTRVTRQRALRMYGLKTERR